MSIIIKDSITCIERNYVVKFHISQNNGLTNAMLTYRVDSRGMKISYDGIFNEREEKYHCNIRDGNLKYNDYFDYISNIYANMDKFLKNFCPQKRIIPALINDFYNYITDSIDCIDCYED
jgi:hypothetical protein